MFEDVSLAYHVVVDIIVKIVCKMGTINNADKQFVAMDESWIHHYDEWTKIQKTIKEDSHGKLNKDVLLHLHRATSHTAAAVTVKDDFGLAEHPPYSPDLVLNNYRLFPELKGRLCGKRFSSEWFWVICVINWMLLRLYLI